MARSLREPPVSLVSAKHPYNFSLTGNYSQQNVDLIQACITRFMDIIGTDLGGVLISSEMCIQIEQNKGNNFRLPYKICLDPRGLTEWTVTHELAHALDGSMQWQISRRMRRETKSGFFSRFFHKTYPAWKLFWYKVGSPPPPCGIDRNFNSLEDFAESVTAFIFPDKAKVKAASRGYPYEQWGYSNFLATPRGKFIRKLIDERKITTPSI